MYRQLWIHSNLFFSAKYLVISLHLKITRCLLIVPEISIIFDLTLFRNYISCKPFIKMRKAFLSVTRLRGVEPNIANPHTSQMFLLVRGMVDYSEIGITASLATPDL